MDICGCLRKRVTDVGIIVKVGVSFSGRRVSVVTGLNGNFVRMNEIGNIAHILSQVINGKSPEGRFCQMKVMLRK